MQYRQISIEEREKIQLGLWEKRSIRDIAQELGRSPSTISREIERNLPAVYHRYTPRVAEERAQENRASRGRTERLKNDTVRTYVVEQLKDGYSPEQIAGRLPYDHPRESISHEAIYRFVYNQIHLNGYGKIKEDCEDLRMYLKRRHKRRVPKGTRTCQKPLDWRANRLMNAQQRSRPVSRSAIGRAILLYQGQVLSASTRSLSAGPDSYVSPSSQTARRKRQAMPSVLASGHSPRACARH